LNRHNQVLKNKISWFKNNKIVNNRKEKIFLKPTSIKNKVASEEGYLVKYFFN